MNEEEKKQMGSLWSGVAKGAFLLLKMVSGKMGLFFIAQNEDASAALAVGGKDLTKAQEIVYMKMFRDRLGKIIEKLEQCPDMDLAADDMCYMHDTDTGEIVPHPDIQISEDKEEDPPSPPGRWN